jgi:cell division protein FtsN
MAKDYKHRAQGKKTPQRRQNNSHPPSVSLWKWMLITALIILFVVFLVYLKSTGTQEIPAPPVSQTPTVKPAKTNSKSEEAAKEKKKTESKTEPKQPRFDFYTILPDKEVVVPEHEIKTRAREERVGKAKETKYIMQAGSFKTFKEADQLRAKLALMGIESKVEKAKVGNVTWNRVKMGPYIHMNSVNVIRSRLRKNGIDVMVTETTR